MKNMEKIYFKGKLLGIQPRIRLLRSFDERSHTYLGYNLFIDGAIEDQERLFSVAVGKATQNKYKFEAGCTIQGYCHAVDDPRKEVAEYYKVSKLEITKKEINDPTQPPPWLGIPEDLTTYRERGHRRLSVSVYENKCSYCIWACKIPVEMIIDQWNPTKKQYRFETFCYGPKSCSLYKSGPTRKVPGRKGMTYEEEDWVDEDATSHRGEDE